MAERWWQENEVTEPEVLECLLRQTITLDDDRGNGSGRGDYDVVKVNHQFVGIDGTHIFAGYEVVLSNGQAVMLYQDATVHDDDDCLIGWHSVRR